MHFSISLSVASELKRPELAQVKSVTQKPSYAVLAAQTTVNTLRIC